MNQKDSPIKSPLATDCALEEIRVSTSRLPIHLVVGAHNTSNIPFHHTGFERHIICVHQVLLANLHMSHAKLSL